MIIQNATRNGMKQEKGISLSNFTTKQKNNHLIYLATSVPKRYIVYFVKKETEIVY